MNRRHRFLPGGVEELERRRVMSALGLVQPVTVRAVPIAHTETGTALRASTEVNQAFDAFTQDYLQAQATYLAFPTNSQDTFRNYITQRTALLSQQLVAIFTPLPSSLNRLPGGTFGGGGSIVIQSFLRRVIGGPNRNGSTPTLWENLSKNIPAVGLAGPQASLATLNATTAIEAARAATLNSVNFLTRHTFHNGHK
jgi:hypothetical protein